MKSKREERGLGIHISESNRLELNARSVSRFASLSVGNYNISYNYCHDLSNYHWHHHPFPSLQWGGRGQALLIILLLTHEAEAFLGAVEQKVWEASKGVNHGSLSLTKHGQVCWWIRIHVPREQSRAPLATSGTFGRFPNHHKICTIKKHIIVTVGIFFW